MSRTAAVGGRPLRRRTALGLGLAALGGGLLSACGDDRPSVLPGITAPPSSTASPTPSAVAAPFGTAPMTGLPASQDGIIKRPAVVVDMFLDGGAPAPTGLDRADVVFEEVTGRNARRLTSVFHSQDVDRIGPVGNTWPSDARNLPVLRPLVANRGDGQKFSNVLGSADGITDLSYADHSAAYTTQAGAKSPYNVFTSTAALYKLAPAGATPPPNMLPFQDNGLPLATTGSVATRQVTITVPGEAPVVWTIDPGGHGWQRGSAPIVFANLAILVMPYREVKTQNHGPSIRTAEVFGSGDAWVAAGGLSVKATWNRKGAFGASLVLDSGGFPIRVVHGTTWMFYAPTGTTVAVG